MNQATSKVQEKANATEYDIQIDKRILAMFQKLNLLVFQIHSFIKEENLCHEDGFVYETLCDLIDTSDQMICKISDIVGNDISTKVFMLQDEFLKQKEDLK